MTGNKGVKRSTRNEIPKSPSASAIGKKGGGAGVVIGVSVTEMNISVSHRLPGRPGSARPIIVKFVRRDTKTSKWTVG